MFAGMRFTARHKVQATILITIGWSILGLCWTILAWGRFSFFQGVVGLGISTLLFAAVVGAMWVVDRGLTPAATIFATLGWLSLTLYWIGFMWTRYGLLQNGAVLIALFFVWLGVTVWLWLRVRAGEWC